MLPDKVIPIPIYENYENPSIYNLVNNKINSINKEIETTKENARKEEERIEAERVAGIENEKKKLEEKALKEKNE